MDSGSNGQNQTTYIEPHILKKYTIIRKIGSGAYGHVWKVQDKITSKIYALKKIFDAFQHSTDAQRTYRQIEILRQTEHPNIIKLIETIKAENKKDVYLVFQFMEADLHNVVAEGILKDVHIKFIVYQVAKALKYLHSGKIIHRDLKPSNVLINSNCFIKICDFGLVRSLRSQDQNSVPTLTQGVATRWYRAPQVLLGSKFYSTPADIWSFGCIIYEILSQKPLFPGNSTVDQIDKILMFTGYPSEEDIQSLESQVAQTMLKQSKVSHNGQKNNFLKDLDPIFADLLSKMIVFSPKKRITIEGILRHEAVKQFRKKQEEIECEKQIRTSIDDNKKLTVDQYRNLIYGTRRSSTPNTYIKNQLQTKKSNSYGKLSSNNTFKTSLADRNQKEKQTLKFARSAKDVMKSCHSYNKSTQMPPSENHVQQHSSHNHHHYPPRQTGQYQFLSRNPTNAINKSGPLPQKYPTQNYQQIRHTLGSPPTTTNFFNSPKQGSMISQTGNRPIYKSSKYVITKTEIPKKSNDRM